MADQDRSGEQLVRTSNPVVDVAPCGVAHNRRTYRSPKLRELGSLAAVRGGGPGQRYDYGSRAYW